MKFGRTLILTLLFFIVVYIYLFQQRIDKDIIAIVPDEISRVFSLGPEERIIRIRVLDHAKKTETALELLKEGWSLTAPVLYPADRMAAEGLVAVLHFAGKQTRLRGEKDPGEYGLDQPRLEIVIETDKKQKETLAFGNPSPIGKAVYARWQSERGYLLLPPEVKSAFEASVYSLREKRIFRMPPAEVQKVSVDIGSHSYQWKKDGAKWYWTEPVSKFGQEILAEEMELILESLLDLHIKEFLDQNKKSEAELGFFLIHDRIRLEGRAGGAEIFYFGNEVPAQNSYYGMKEKETGVFFVDRVKVFQLLDLLRSVENAKDARDKVPLKVMAQSSGADLP